MACEPVIGGSWAGVYYLFENIIHYYYCQSEGGEESSQGGGRFPPFPPTRKYPSWVPLPHSLQARHGRSVSEYVACYSCNTSLPLPCKTRTFSTHYYTPATTTTTCACIYCRQEVALDGRGEEGQVPQPVYHTATGLPGEAEAVL